MFSVAFSALSTNIVTTNGLILATDLVLFVVAGSLLTGLNMVFCVAPLQRSQRERTLLLLKERNIENLNNGRI